VNFDRVAPYYRELEILVFGRQLQEARIAFVRQISPPVRVLIAGEGNGRFLAEFVRQFPGTEITCVEASARMIVLARKGLEAGRVNFVQEDIREVTIPAAQYDLIVTHFLLDCFGAETLERLIRKLAAAATPKAQWLIADFCEPAGGWSRFRARFLIAIMYFFFRTVARIEAKRLVNYRPWLRECGFALTREILMPNEMIRSELWERTA
jgi:ubiquinone/menaquinone biosynthesis C-methylase UbiE